MDNSNIENVLVVTYTQREGNILKQQIYEYFSPIYGTKISENTLEVGGVSFFFKSIQGVFAGLGVELIILHDLDRGLVKGNIPYDVILHRLYPSGKVYVSNSPLLKEKLLKDEYILSDYGEIVIN